jgi:hypothetical protein
VKVATERDDPAHAKFSGLLIDRIEVVPVDLRGALEAAERRLIDITPLPCHPGSR